MKFDVIVGNPPYKDGTHLKHLQNAINISKNYIVFIQPSSWVLSIKKHKHNSLDNKAKEQIKNILFKLILVNGNKYFSANLGVPIGIFYININKKSKEIIVDNKITNTKYITNDINEINMFDNNKNFISINNKIKNIKKMIDYVKTNGKWYVNVAQVRGHMNKESGMTQWDFYTFLPEDSIPIKNKKMQYFGFKTREEAQNFIDSLRTKFIRYCLKTVKLNGNLHRGELSFVPWMEDYSKSWTDQELYEYFKLTKEEIDYIESNI